MGGVLPFGAVFIELFFLFSSIFNDRYALLAVVLHKTMAVKKKLVVVKKELGCSGGDDDGVLDMAFPSFAVLAFVPLFSFCCLSSAFVCAPLLL
jgi:hypothetical protein